MKLLFNQEWLDQRINEDANETCEVGSPIHRAADFVSAIQEARDETVQNEEGSGQEGVLSLFVHQVRRRDKLSVEELADRLRVSPDEISAIEQNPKYDPQPRTLHKLAGYTKVPAANLVRITPDAHNTDAAIESASMQFAASSDDVASLSRTERRRLNDFVKFLVQYKGNDKANAR